ncbi:transcriptional regulator [Jeotgalibacillus alimentarius]|uniref:Regulatory protein MsrR n=1 Tax=Jeotgalibacillus alimentarius TaxID=135826 RepID=A0A0C2VIT2_9BACL|nr:LCP family protein [Jeotgalibacillus alimentarius]KIL48792.1 transcriptional regulator [Jeotgalibacillus alimentarius]
METRMKRRKKKLRKGRAFLTLMIIIFLAVAGYAGSQYWSGYQSAKGSAQEMHQGEEFERSTPENGKRNILLIGVDSRGEEQSRSDTMMIAQWDHETDTIKLVSLMRDIYAEIPGYGPYKLNTAFYLDGPELLRKTIDTNFDIPIHDYMIVDFKAFETAVDTIAPDGVPINVEKAMSEKIGVSLEAGEQKLNGQELLGYARFRADSEGDFGRVDRQQQVIEALIDHSLSVSSITRAPKTIGSVQPYLETSLSETAKLKLFSSVLFSGGGEVERLTVPVEGSYSTPRYEGAGAVLELDWAANQEAIKNFLK